ncbi:MAG: hypothetical protein ACRDHY_19225, partial [Anaerolineales bacterium]
SSPASKVAVGLAGGDSGVAAEEVDRPPGAQAERTSARRVRPCRLRMSVIEFLGMVCAVPGRL